MSYLMTKIAIGTATFYYNLAIDSGKKKRTFYLSQALKHLNIISSSTFSKFLLFCIGTKTILQISTKLF